MTAATVVVPTLDGAARLTGLLRSLTPGEYQVIVVDNGSRDGTADLVRRDFPGVEVVELDRNLGFSRAVNIGAERAEGRALVLLNNDCVCEPGFVEALVEPLRRGDECVMAAAVMREARDPATIDSAGMELDGTLLVFDYLNGHPVSVLGGDVPDPVGPSAAAAAFDLAAFREVGGFDENLFAYWEDVDLVVRLRLLGGRCALAREAVGTHAHSATLGSGSAAKNELMGFGRGYLLRKWSVVSPARLPAVLARELAICAAQALVDRTLAGIRGRVRGFAAAGTVPRSPYPAAALAPGPKPGLAGTFVARARRRGRIRATGEAV
jgi:GT2 family glycosyltransferase